MPGPIVEGTNTYKSLHNVKIMLMAFGMPAEAFHYNPQTKTLRIDASNVGEAPLYVELKDGSSNMKVYYQARGELKKDKIENIDLRHKFFVKDGKYLCSGSAGILSYVFNYGSASFGPSDSRADNLETIGWVHFAIGGEYIK